MESTVDHVVLLIHGHIVTRLKTSYYFPPSSSDISDLLSPQTNYYFPLSSSDISGLLAPQTNYNFSPFASDSCTLSLNPFSPPVSHVMAPHSPSKILPATDPCVSSEGIQPVRIRPTLKQSDASKVNKDIQAKTWFDNAALLKAEINLIIATRDALIEEAAKKFNVSVKKITKTVNAESNYKKTCKPTIFNALVSEKKEMNEGLALGDRYKLCDLQDAAKLELDDLTDAQKEQLLLRFSRANTIAAAQDARSTVVNFGVELEKLTARTGIQGVGLFVGGHMHDNFIGTILQCKGSRAFFKDVMGHSGADMLAKFEQWSWSKDTVSSFKALHVGTCMWKLMSKLDNDKLKAKITALEDAGEMVGTARRR
ncbi:hypothetical protein BYT27DRAFT_7208409 [Phlegmacium glaucopus]|nr:hypothetical protein BYT27DRAFT_7208409 [Phlegmacium glaucopus]